MTKSPQVPAVMRQLSHTVCCSTHHQSHCTTCVTLYVGRRSGLLCICDPNASLYMRIQCWTKGRNCSTGCILPRRDWVPGPHWGMLVGLLINKPHQPGSATATVLAGRCPRMHTCAAVTAHAGCPSHKCCLALPTSCTEASAAGSSLSRRCWLHATCHGEQLFAAAPG